MEVCEEKKSPVILGISESAISYIGGYTTVFNIVKSLMLDLNITIPVVLHLDHGKNLESCKKALDAGFTSVMIDASTLPIEQNIKITNQVIEYAMEKGATVEGELGIISKGNVTEYTSLEQAIFYTSQAKVDALAPALGSVHGLYQNEPNLDFNTMLQMSENITVPLVLHGGSGIEDDKIRKSISCGVCKINFNTELQIAWAREVKKFIQTTDEYDPRKIIKSGEIALKQVVSEKIELLGSTNKA